MKTVHVFDTPQERRLVRRANSIRDDLAKLEKARDKHIVKMSEAGIPVRAIGAEIGIGHGTVQRIAAESKRQHPKEGQDNGE